MGISKDLTEEDVKFRYINEAITSKGWSKDSIFMEQKVKFTDGKISLHGNLVHREKPKFADYVLYANKATPLAIVEAKDANHSVSHGLQQAMTYAQMLDVKFAYSSNGEGFAEHDFLTGKERTFAMDEFPTKEELIERYKNEANDGNGLNEQELAIIEQPFLHWSEYFSATILSAQCRKSYCQCYSKRAKSCPSCHGNWHRQDIYCISDCMAFTKKWVEEESVVSCRQKHIG